MGAAYVTAADVAAVLDLPETARLAADAPAGSNRLSLQQPADLAPGAFLAVGYRGLAAEVVQVRAMPDPQTLELAGPLTSDHAVGERIRDVTPFQEAAEAASRLVDDITYGRPEWLLYGEVEEIHWAISDRRGNLTVPVNKRPVRAVLDFRYQQAPYLPEWSAPVEQVWFDDDSYLIHAFVPVPALPQGSRVRVKVRYQGGYRPEEMPADIRRATAALAARLWKEKDSGFSDVIGSPELGVVQYTKAVPADVLAMLERWRRVA